MNILFIGDIFGRPGRNTVTHLLKSLREQHKIDFVIANAENIRHGKGVSESHLSEMQKAGVDFFTSGNHVYKNKDIIPLMDDPKLPLLRPANYPEGVPGRGYEIVKIDKMKPVLVINLLGRVFMRENTDCPFRVVDKILKEHENKDLSATIVDFHAEATSEKVALGHYLDGRVTALLGTHTHVPTADERILENGTAYQSDVGFVGPLNSVIGSEKDPVIEQFITQMPIKYEVAGGPTIFNATKIEIDDKTKRAISIERIQHTVDSF